jgi:hypothetical protein
VNSNQWATHLTHISAREPGNLINHVRRIYLHLLLKQREPLYGAMLDLYLALGDKGWRLRHDLFKKSRKILSQEESDLFFTSGKKGLHPQQPIPPSQYSVLGNFFTGKLPLVKEQTGEQQSYNQEMDPLELAKEELNYGDITVAQQILEEALQQSPNRPGLHYALLEIYQHTRSLDDLLKMKERLGDGIAVAQATWNQTQKAIEANQD